MKPSDEIIEKFQKLYYQEFGEEISRQQAHEKFMRVVNLVRVIIRPNAINTADSANTDFHVPGFDRNFTNGNI
jgi:hypothetical protein